MCVHGGRNIRLVIPDFRIGFCTHKSNIYLHFSVWELSTTCISSITVGFAFYLIIEHLASRPEDIYHVTVMPCYDKKLEASRDDFVFGVESDGDGAVVNITEVDSVLTSGEVLELIQV